MVIWLCWIYIYHIISYHWFYLAATLPRHGRETRPSSQPPRLRPLNPDCSRKRTAGFCTLMRWRWALVTQRLRGEFWVGTRLLPWKKTRFLQRDGAPIMEVSMGKSSIYMYIYIYRHNPSFVCVYCSAPWFMGVPKWLGKEQPSKPCLHWTDLLSTAHIWPNVSGNDSMLPTKILLKTSQMWSTMLVPSCFLEFYFLLVEQTQILLADISRWVKPKPSSFVANAFSDFRQIVLSIAPPKITRNKGSDLRKSIFFWDCYSMWSTHCSPDIDVVWWG